MASVQPAPPLNVSGYAWRALRPDDREEIVSLRRACAEAHGDLLDCTPDFADIFDAPRDPQTFDAICAMTELGHIAAIGWVRIDTLPDGYRAYLVGAVRPDHRNRGLGRAVLTWTEFRARQLLRMLPQDRPAVIRIDFSDVRPDAERLYARLGFLRWFRVHEMQRDLSSPIVDCLLPEGMRLVAWSAAHAQTFHAVHEDAWSDRVGATPLDLTTWVAAWTGDDEFLPDASLVALDGDEGAALILCHIERKTETGWISKVGARPCYRERGIASALVTLALHSFREMGLAAAKLEVAEDNPNARRVYERLGFAIVSHRTVYRKSVMPPS
ncbi:MAG: GNAT family N-acetyltransferase [Thermomicrobiales bacterium]